MLISTINTTRSEVGSVIELQSLLLFHLKWKGWCWDCFSFTCKYCALLICKQVVYMRILWFSPMYCVIRRCSSLWDCSCLDCCWTHDQTVRPRCWYHWILTLCSVLLTMYVLFPCFFCFVLYECLAYFLYCWQFKWFWSICREWRCD